MKKTYSARKRLVRNFVCLFAVTMLLGLAYGVYSSMIYDRQMRYCADAAMEVNSGMLIQETDRLAFFNRHLTASSLIFRHAASLSSDEFTAISLLYQIQSLMKATVPDAGLMMIFDDSGDSLRYVYGELILENRSILHPEHISVAHALRDRCLEMPDSEMDQWLVFESDPFVFLYRFSRYQHMGICSALELNALADLTEKPAEDSPQLLFDKDGVFITDRETAAEKGLRPESLYGFRSLLKDYSLAHRDIPSLGIGLNVLVPKEGVWKFSGITLLVMISVGIVCCIMFVIAYRMMNRFMIYPLQQISSLSQHMADVNEEDIPLLQDPEPVEELNTLHESLNSLVTQKIRLRKSRQDEETEKEHALLQYYQLQTRSHFFLNCLKSLYGMLETRDFPRMQEMIISFSNHLRYIFHDNLSLVPLRSEMDEVRDYHRIISMDCRQPLILTQEIAPDAMNCLVPPLIVQTFLENSYKYNGRGREALNFVIRIDRMDYEGRERLRVRLSDDGLGYSQEALEELNRPVPSSGFDQYHIGISNLRRRMGILFRGDFELAFFNGVSGGANVLISIPVREEEGEEA